MREVHRHRRLEIGAGAGLEAQPRHARRACRLHDVVEHRRTNAAPARCLGGVHRLHLAMIRRHALERADAKQRLAIPGAEETDLRHAQSGEIQREGEAFCRGRPRLGQMRGEQRLHPRIVQAALGDCHAHR